jgi:methylenetetrahydrofolate dehydrogenase (NADP+)/methenyltetrahydrofolate cyclohydrolase
VTAQILDGKATAAAIRAELAGRVAALRDRGVIPGLATVLVGDDPGSHSYVRGKHKASAEIGIASIRRDLPATATQAEVEKVVAELNDDPAVHGYLVQLPLPKGLDAGRVLERVDPAKDADGLHPVNLGKLVLQEPGPVPCTPAGIQAMFVHYRIDVAGRNVVIAGRGPTLGRPLALLLTLKQPGANAAVTVVHTGVPDLVDYTRNADILIAAVGVPSFITPDMVKPGSVVVSGGIVWEGRRLLPDVDESVADVAGWITPRLGGVGRTTVALLLRNTVALAENRVASAS